MDAQYQIGDNVTVHTCNGLFDCIVRGFRKTFGDQLLYDCTGHKQGKPRQNIVTSTSLRSIVGSPEYSAKCESDCPFRRDCKEYQA